MREPRRSAERRRLDERRHDVAIGVVNRGIEHRARAGASSARRRRAGRTSPRRTTPEKSDTRRRPLRATASTSSAGSAARSFDPSIARTATPTWRAYVSVTGRANGTTSSRGVRRGRPTKRATTTSRDRAYQRAFACCRSTAVATRPSAQRSTTYRRPNTDRHSGDDGDARARRARLSPAARRRRG